MNEEQKWDELLSNDAKQNKKRQRASKLETAGNVANGVSTIIFIAALVIVGAVAAVLFGTGILR